MNAQANAVPPAARHNGPPLGWLAVAYTVLFNAGLWFVVSFSAVKPHFPGPWEPPGTIVSYFQEHASAALMCAFFHFGAAIPLGIFTATAVSRLRFLGVRRARWRSAQRPLLFYVRLRRRGFFGSAGLVGCWRVRLRRFCEAAAEVDRGLWNYPGHCWRVELVQPHSSQGIVPDSVYALPRIRMANCGWVQSSEGNWSGPATSA